MKSKRALSILLALVFVLTLLPAVSIPAKADTSGSCGSDLTFSLSGTTLTISGTGAMYNYSSQNSFPVDNDDYITKIIVNSGVTSIGDYAFTYFRRLEQVSLPDTLKSIGDHAFYGAGLISENLSINLPSSLLSIGESALATTGLKHIVIPGSLTDIGNYAFSNNKNLTSAEIREGVRELPTRMLYSCEALTQVTLPSSLKTIGDEAFWFCGSLQNVTIPSGVTSIGARAFGDTLLASVYLPSSLTSIGRSAFAYTNLEEVTIPVSVTSIGSGAFGSCSYLSNIFVIEGNSYYTAQEGVLFNKSKTELHTYPAGKSGSSYVIPSGVTSIGDRAFLGCSKLVSVTIPSGVTSIGENAFYNCSKLESVTIPSSVTSIGNYAFNGNSSLGTVTFLGHAPSIGAYTFSDVTSDVYYPGDSTWTEDVLQNYGGTLTWIANITGPTIDITSDYFPDAAFRIWVSKTFDKNSDVSLSPSELAAVTEIDIRNKGIASLKGIEYFPKLKKMYCDGNQLSSLNVSQNTALESLLCSGNPLTSLNVTKNTALTVLDVRDCQLNSLDVTKNTALEYLYCQNNQLRTLNITQNPLLRNLWCYGNSISFLSISENNHLLDAFLNGDDTVYDDDGTYRAYELEEENNYYLYVDVDTVVSTSPIAAPVITTQPKAQTAAVGAKATFKVVASGTGLTYQWQYSRNGTSWTDKAGATSASYTVTAKASYNGLYYRCKVSNSGGEVFSSKARLTVTSTAAPTITTQPANKTVAAGEKATFKVVASGTGLTYQWQYKTAGSTTWKNKTGATSASYTVTAKESFNGIQYRCVVSNAGGKVTSNAAKLTVTAAVTAPVITTQPKAQTAAVGATATYKVVASGTGLTYQWQYSSDYGATWHNKTGATSATYTVTAKASYNGMLYRCKVSNSAGAVYSSKVRLTVSGVKPKVLSQPKAKTAAVGESVTFKVVAAGVDMTYQWQYSFDGTTWKNKTGATSASCTVTAKASYNGILYRCRVKNSYGTVYSESAKLTVN